MEAFELLTEKSTLLIEQLLDVTFAVYVLLWPMSIDPDGFIEFTLQVHGSGTGVEVGTGALPTLIVAPVPAAVVVQVPPVESVAVAFMVELPVLEPVKLALNGTVESVLLAGVTKFPDREKTTLLTLAEPFTVTTALTLVSSPTSILLLPGTRAMPQVG